MLPYTWVKTANTFVHNRCITAVTDTPCIQAMNTGLMLFSMLRHSDVLMYLVAIKSVFARLGPGLITVLDDGSLTARDRALLQAHILGIRFLHINAVNTERFPKGGTWERLLSIVDLTNDYYVIQVDADIVALGRLDEVLGCIGDNRAFTLAGNPVALVETAEETSARVRNLWSSPNGVQPAAESILDQMPHAPRLRYIWGTSAFTGFPRGSGGRKKAYDFSKWMSGRLGPLWETWGSEQVTSNFLIANCPDPLVLPWQKYQCYEPPEYSVGTELNHFYGTYRFVGGAYRMHSRRAISMLRDRTAE
jgi:hypothetical protein